FPDRFYNGNKENDPEYIETYKNNKERYQNIVPDWDQGIISSDHHWIDKKDFTDNNNSINPMSGWHILYGGDLQGIEKKFGYLTDLGINTIYLNPIFEATSNHKYNSSGYEYIEDNFAFKADTERSNKYFEEFIKKAHKNGIRIVLDGVFNHTGYEHYAFQDVIEKGENSKYWDWYYIKSYPINTLYEQRTEGIAPNYESWAGFGSLPKLNVNNQEVQNYIFEVTKRWMDPNKDGNYEDGIDGWRLDVPNEVKDRNLEFWVKWRSHVKSINPEAYIVGEIWGDGSEYLKGDEFDAVMNYRFRDAVLNLLNDNLSKEKFVAEINKIKADYPKPAFYSLLNLIDSHDTERFLNSLNGDVKKFKVAVFFQYIFPGTPVIYYGDEIGMEGDKDPDNRRTMIWESRGYLDKPNIQLKNFYKKLINIRKNNKVLTNGDIIVSTYQGNDDIVIIKRSYEQEKIVGIVNLSFKKIEFVYNIEDKMEVTDLITGEKYSTKNNRLEVKLSENQIMLIK
ncbi:MAG: glycoside hydrolase family 13 protein, partial [Halanaerobiales bacterium]|nr:glycoside hydrolase family 13 protein [Halanaerobiales bacterium]